MSETLPAGTVTFLVIDIEGSTRLLHALGDAYSGTLEAYRRLVRSSVATWHGHEVSAEGDGFFLAFARALDALQAAIAIQRELMAATPTAAGLLRARMGIHTGQPEIVGGDYIGLDVHRAARIGAVGHGGQALLSRATRDLVEAELPHGISLRDLGEHRLKDLPRVESLTQLLIAGLPSDFGPLRTDLASTNHLPEQMTTFIGRQRELAEARTRMLHTRLLTLTGSGGTGKTRFAIELAKAVCGQFEDGVWFVALAPIMDPNLVFPTILQVLGIPDEQGRTPEVVLRETVRGKHTLLVLDNFEQVVDAGPAVAALLAVCPHLSLLVTSRTSLHVTGEQELEAPPLALPPREREGRPIELIDNDAVGLFVDRARAVKSDFALTEDNSAAVVGVCARLDGLPLAIELAAARVRLLPPATLLSRLGPSAGAAGSAGGPSLQLLTGGARDQSERQQTLRATIAWSYDLLDPREQALFRRLAIFVGGFTLEAAEAAATTIQVGDRRWALSAWETLERLESLISKHLIRDLDGSDTQPRFTMLETIREFGLEQLDACGELHAMHRWHAEHFLLLVERAEPLLHGSEQATWLNRLDAEHDNFRAALEWCLSERRPDQLPLRLAGSLAWFWQSRAYLREGRAWLERILLLPWESTPAKAKAHIGLAWLAHVQRDSNTARVALDDGLAICREHGERWWEGWGLHILGRVAYMEGNAGPLAGTGKAESGGGSGCAVALAGRAWAIHLLGLSAHITNDFTSALAYYDEAVRIRRGIGFREGIAICLNLMAMVAYRQDDATTAHRLMKEGLREIQATAGFWLASTGLADAAAIAASFHRPEEAARLLGAIHTISDLTGASPIPLAEMLVNETEERVKSVLGVERYQHAWAEGLSMTLDDAIAVAMALEPASANAMTNEPADEILSVSPLTSREESVLRLIAQGLTTREISESLVVSVATVDRHLTHIYTKLGVRGRAEAIAWAMRNGLAE